MPIHSISKCSNTFCFMQYECGMQSGGGCSLTSTMDTTMLFSFVLSQTPIFQNFTPTCTGITEWECVHISISSVWRCSNTLYKCNSMDMGCGGLQPWSWHHNFIQAQAYPNFPKNHPCLEPAQRVFQSKGAPIFLSTISQRGLQPQPWHHNHKVHSFLALLKFS